MSFTEEQITRYSRHILLPEVGGRDKRKLPKQRYLSSERRAGLTCGPYIWPRPVSERLA